MGCSEHPVREVAFSELAADWQVVGIAHDVDQRTSLAAGFSFKVRNFCTPISLILDGKLRLQVERVGTIDWPDRLFLHTGQHSGRRDPGTNVTHGESFAFDILEPERFTNSRSI